MLNSRSSTYAALFPLVRRLVTRSVREPAGPIGTGRIEWDVELVVTPQASISENVTSTSQKKWEQIGFWECDVEFSEGAIKSKTFPVYNAG